MADTPAPSTKPIGGTLSKLVKQNPVVLIGLVGLLFLGYLWWKSRQTTTSQSSTTDPNAADLYAGYGLSDPAWAQVQGSITNNYTQQTNSAQAQVQALITQGDEIADQVQATLKTKKTTDPNAAKARYILYIAYGLYRYKAIIENAADNTTAAMGDAQSWVSSAQQALSDAEAAANGTGYGPSPTSPSSSAPKTGGGLPNKIPGNHIAKPSPPVRKPDVVPAHATGTADLRDVSSL